MTTRICPITRLPLEYQEPVVSLLLTAQNRRVTAQGPFDPYSVWEPRAMPALGTYDENLAVAWEASPILDLWERGLRTDVVPRRGRASKGEVIGRRATLGQFLSAVNTGELFVRDHVHDWTSKLDPAMPTRVRVERALSGATDKPLGVATMVGPAVLFPVVDVHLHLRVEETGDASLVAKAQEYVVDLARKHGWGARGMVGSTPRQARGYGLVEIVPCHIGDAIEREHDRRVRRGPRSVYPIALGLYSARGWQALLDAPAEGFVGASRVVYSAHYFRCILGRVADVWAKYPPSETQGTVERAARDRHMRLLYALQEATGGFIPAPFHDVVFRTSWRLGMCWHLAGVLDAGWSTADRDAALDRTAELLAVGEAMGALGFTWGPAASARSGRPWEALAGLARVTETEAERRRAAEAAEED